MQTVISIQARMGSTRLPGKVLLGLGNARVVEWVIRRCRRAQERLQREGAVVVATGDRSANDAIVEFCERAGIGSIVGPEDDLVERHCLVAEETNADRLIRITADCPFVPPGEIVRTARVHARTDARYTRNDRYDSESGSSMPIGTAVEVFDVDVLASLRAQGENHPNKPLLTNPDQWEISFSPNPELESYADAHIAVDEPADYWALTDALEAVGPDPTEVIKWVDEHR